MICRLIADCETFSRAPAAVKEPVSAIARMISSCLRSMVPSIGRDPAGSRGISEMKRIYQSYRTGLWLEAAVAAERTDPVAEVLKIGHCALQAGVGPGRLYVDVKGVF